MARKDNQNELGAFMAAQNEISGITSSRLQNSQAEQAFLQQQQAANSIMMQAAQIGTTDVGQQVGGMNPQTQALLAQYGINPNPIPGKSTSTQRTAQSGGNIRIENNTTNNHEVKVINTGGNSGESSSMNQAKFQTWLSNSFAKQQNEYETQRRIFSRRDRDLEKQSNKLMRQLESSTKGLTEKLNPENFTKPLGSQFKTMMILLMTTFAPKLIEPIGKAISSVENIIRGVFGGKDGEEPTGLAKTIKEAFDIKDDQTFFEKLKEEFHDLGTFITEWFQAMIEERKEAIKKVSESRTGWDKLLDGLSTVTVPTAIGRAMKIMATMIPQYLGAALGGLSYTSSSINNEIKDNAKDRETVASRQSNLTAFSAARFEKDYIGGVAEDKKDFRGNINIKDNQQVHATSMYMKHLLTGNEGKLDVAGIQSTFKQISRVKGLIELGTFDQAIDWLNMFITRDEALEFIRNESYIISEIILTYYYKSGQYTRSKEVKQGEKVELPQNAIIDIRELKKDPNIPEVIKKSMGDTNPKSTVTYYLTQEGKLELERIIGNRYNNGEKFSFSNISESTAATLYSQNQNRLYSDNSEYIENLSIQDEKLYNELNDTRLNKEAIYGDVREASEDLDFYQGAKNFLTTSIKKAVSWIKGGDITTDALGNAIFGEDGYNRISGEFGDDRGTYTHKGIDFAVNRGTKVRTPFAGTVISVSDSGETGYGKNIKIRTEDGHILVFGHLSKQLVKEGDRVPEGQVIAKSGNTGSSTGPHLHFEVRTANQEPINPTEYFSSLALNPDSEAEEVGENDNDFKITKTGIPYAEFAGGYRVFFDKDKQSRGINSFDAVQRVELQQADGSYKVIDKNLVTENKSGAFSLETQVNRYLSNRQYPELQNPSLDFATTVGTNNGRKKIPLGKYHFYGTPVGRQLVNNTYLLCCGPNSTWDGCMEFDFTPTKDYKSIHSIRTWSIQTNHSFPANKENSMILEYYCTGNTIYSIEGFSSDFYRFPGVEIDTKVDKNYNPLFYSSGIYLPPKVIEDINSYLENIRVAKWAIKNGIFEIDPSGGINVMKDYDEIEQLLSEHRDELDLIDGNGGLNFKNIAKTISGEIKSGDKELLKELATNKDLLMGMYQGNLGKKEGHFKYRTAGEQFSSMGKSIFNKFNDLFSFSKINNDEQGLDNKGSNLGENPSGIIISEGGTTTYNDNRSYNISLSSNSSNSAVNQ